MSAPVVYLDQERGRDVLRVSASDFKGATYVDIRVWYRDREGELRPTSKGVSLRPDAVAAVIEALQDARDALEVSR